MKFKEAINIYNQFLRDPPYEKGDTIKESVVLLPEHTDDYTNLSRRNLYSFAFKLPMVVYKDGKIKSEGDFNVLDFCKDTWEICIYTDRTMSMSSFKSGNKFHQYRIKTQAVIKYLEDAGIRV